MNHWFEAVEQIFSVILGIVLVYSGKANVYAGAKPIPSPTSIQISVTPTSNPTPIVKTVTVRAKTNSLNEALNSYRREHDLPGLQKRADLCKAAQTRLTEITTDFSHAGFKSALNSLHYQAAAENIWQGSLTTAGQVIVRWQASEGHRANMQGNWLYGCGAENGTRAVFLFMR